MARADFPTGQLPVGASTRELWDFVRDQIDGGRRQGRRQAVHDPQAERVSRLDVQGMNHVSFDTPEAFAAFQRTEVDRWSKIITRAGVKPE